MLQTKEPATSTGPVRGGRSQPGRAVPHGVGWRPTPLMSAVAVLVCIGIVALWSVAQAPPERTSPSASQPSASQADGERTLPNPVTTEDCEVAASDTPDDPVESDDAPASAAVDPPGPVALVGDSITFEHEAIYRRYLAACGRPFAVVDAIGGRMLTTTEHNPFGPIPSGMEAISEIERTLDPDVWLLQLGVNDVNTGVFDDGGFECAIDDVLAAVDPDDAVFWVGPYTIGPHAEMAVALADALRTDPRVTMIDWPAAAPDLVYDGLHATHEGARHLAGMYCAALR